MTGKNYYDILGISPDANDLEIKASYRKLVQKFHPDKNKGDKFFEEYFKNVLEAYEILSNPDSRRQYDSIRKNKNEQNQDNNKHNYQIDIFVDNNNIKVGSLVKLIVKIDTNAADILVPNIPGLRKIKDPYKIPKETYKETEVGITKFGYFFVPERSGYIIIPALNILLDNNTIVKTPVKRLRVIDSDNTNTYNHQNSKNINSKSNPNSNLRKYLFFSMFVVALLTYIAILQKNDKNNSNRENRNSYNSGINDINRERDRQVGNTQSSEDRTVNEHMNTLPIFSEYLGNQLNTGDSPYDNYFGKGIYRRNSYNFIEFENGMRDDAIVCLVSLGTNRVIRNEYIRRGDNFRMTNIPDGQYYVKTFYGKNWNPEKKLLNGNIVGGFDTGLRFSKSDQSDDIFELRQTQTSTGIRYSTFQVTLYPVTNGNMESENIDESEFFQ